MNIVDDFLMYGRGSKSVLRKFWVAATSMGVYVMAAHRLSSALWNLGSLGKVLSRIVDLFMNFFSGCYISPKAIIGPGLYLPHPTGVVIGDGVRIGKQVTIYQHVTLGSRSVGAKAYPEIGHEVRIFPNSVIAGSVCIGNKVTVGAGAIVLCNIPDGCTAVGNPARVIKPKAAE